MPVLTIVAGPNGSGKSSILFGINFEGRANLLEADAIAKRMRPQAPRLAAIPASREAILRTREHLRAGQSFSVETTLSGSGTLKTMAQAKSQGYAVHLIYVCLDVPERCIVRVRERVARGGHDVPDEDVRRRYKRSLFNLSEAVRLAHQGIIFDNSGSKPQKMIETLNGIVTWRRPTLPAWIPESLGT